jgi:hypothetical protein
VAHDRGTDCRVVAVVAFDSPRSIKPCLAKSTIGLDDP